MTMSISQLFIEPERQATQGRFRDVVPDPVVPSAVVSVKGTDANTDGAVGILIDPEFETFFRVNSPFCDADKVGTNVCFRALCFKGNGCRGAAVGAAIADLAEGRDTYFFWCVMR